MVTLQLRQIDIPPGQRILFRDVSWQEFEAILDEMGENRASRVAYSQGILEIMSPLREHETTKVFISDFVKMLLDEMGTEWISLGSTTFRKEVMAAGIEPDDCFYIQNYVQMVGKKRLDLSVDPPPDLALEVDLTSKTQMVAYEALKVPEVWCFDNGVLKIYVLQNDHYELVQTSPTFPDLSLVQMIPQFIRRGQSEPMSAVRRSFRQWLKEQTR
ncbi:MAG: Uma2 family endonuclease [Myxacorys chilensis ATA2-1-KO14]|jgi:Uma2 family endonuclease|nr:Uma2 family endonuclease [Myxacorys chilensis ATA2-1-KO14]